MRIGIDIDDTLTNIRDRLTDSAFEYAKSLNKSIENKELKINDIYNNGNIYQKMFDFTYEELKYFLGTIQEEITNNDNNNTKELEEKLEKIKLILNKHKLNLKKYESGE